MFSGIKDAVSALKEYLVLAEKVQQNKDETARLEKEVANLKKDVSVFFEKVEVLLEKHFERVQQEIRTAYEKEAVERKIALLELENKILTSKKALPPKSKK